MEDIIQMQPNKNWTKILNRRDKYETNWEVQPNNGAPQPPCYVLVPKPPSSPMKSGIR